MAVTASVLAISASDLVSFAALLLAFYVARYYYKYFTRTNPLPGPFPLPLIGNLHQAGTDLGRWAMRNQKTYGDLWEVYMGSQRTIWLGHAKYLDKVNSSSIKGSFLLRAVNDGIEDMDIISKGTAFNADLETWKFARRMIVKCVATIRFMPRVISLVQEVFKEAESYWAKLGIDKEEKVIDMSIWASRMTVDLTFQATAGTRAYSLAYYYNTIAKEKSNEYPESAVQDSEIWISKARFWLNTMQFFFFVPRWIRKYVPIVSYYNKIHMDNMEWLYDSLVNMVRKRKAEIADLPEGAELPTDFMSLLCINNTDRDVNRITEEGYSRPLTEDEIRAIIFEVLGGGVDSVSSTFCFTLFQVLKYPEVRKRMMKEFEDILGSDPYGEITYEDTTKLEYCEAVIKEAARILPALAILFKENVREDEVAGYVWPAHTTFFVHNHGIHLNPDIWSEPSKFDPDRFLAPNVTQKNAHIPFGGGVRICPGRTMAVHEVKTLLACLLRRYNIELNEPDKPMDYRHTMTNICNQLPVRISKK